MLKILAKIIFFYILILLQASFLVHFNLTNNLLSYILILIPLITFSFLTPQKQREDMATAFSAGFFLDIFSGQLIGTSILVFTLIVFFIKFVVKKHINL